MLKSKRVKKVQVLRGRSILLSHSYLVSLRYWKVDESGHRGSPCIYLSSTRCNATAIVRLILRHQAVRRDSFSKVRSEKGAPSKGIQSSRDCHEVSLVLDHVYINPLVRICVTGAKRLRWLSKRRSCSKLVLWPLFYCRWTKCILIVKLT